MWLTAAIVALLLVGLVIGATVNIAALFLAIPIALAVVVVVALRGRREAPPSEQEIEFTGRDRETLYSGGPERTPE